MRVETFIRKELRDGHLHDGKIVHHGDTPAGYLTDVPADVAMRFIRQQTFS